MKKKKIIAIPLLLILLTGCSHQYSDSTIGEIISWANSTCLNFLQFLNSLYASMFDMMAGLVENLGELTTKYIGQYGSAFASIVSVASILAAAAILIRFAISVFKNNMAEQNKELAPDFTTILKRIIVTIVITLALPYLCITSFIASGYIGGMAASKIITDTPKLKEWVIYDEMREKGVKYSTYCINGQNSSISWESSKNSAGDIFFLSEGNSKTLTGKDYSYWCGTENAEDVYMAKFDGKDVAPLQDNLAVFDFLVILLKMLILMIITCVTSFSYAKLAVELLFQVATGWWYTSSYLTDTPQEESSLSKMFNSILKICLTSFFLAFEIALYVVIVAGNTDASLALSLAFLMVMLSTPSAVGDMIMQTGTGGQATKLAGGIFKKLQ